MKRNILLIGGSYGIGLEIVKLLQAKDHVYVASRSLGDLGDLDVVHLPFDALTDSLEDVELPELIHGFVYCPGSIALKLFKRLPLDTIRSEMELNFFALARCAQSILPRMAPQASMVFFSTVAVGVGMPFHTSIAAAKGAVEGFTRSLAAEYAPRVRVNCIAPSLVETPLSGKLLGSDKKKEALSERHPLKRIGTVGDIANLAVFLLDGENSWITGQVIGIDGGMSALRV